MTNRRQFCLSAAAVAGSGAALSACSAGSGDADYGHAVQETWRHSAGKFQDQRQQQLDLVRYATLAPSSHNTQCWKFKLGDGHISILPDAARRCPAVDPDDHHLYVSLGCAAENLVQAASAAGFHSEPAFNADAGAIDVLLTRATPQRTALFEAIPQRQCTRVPYDGRAAAASDLKLLEQAGTGQGVRVLLFTGKPQVEQILEYVTRANSAQLADPAFIAELKHWIRFNPADAVASGDGLYSGSTGNPALPQWLGSPFMSLLFKASSENDKYAEQIRSSSGIAVFVSDSSDKAHWVETGRCYERFALQSTALGLRNAMLNQPVEVAQLRPQFSSWLGLTGGRPDLVVRFGYGPEMPRSMRRQVDSVLF